METFSESHPILDMEEQRTMVAEEHWREHTKWCELQCEASRLSVKDRRIALKMLLNEAFQRDRRNTVAANASQDELQLLRKKWYDIGVQAMKDMTTGDNSPLVLRNLSSMCVFIAGKVCREYCDNTQERMRRMQNQYTFLTELQQKGVLFAKC